MAENRTRAARGGPGHGPQGHGFQRPKDMRGTFGKLMHYVGRYKGALAVVTICLVASSAGSVATSYMLKPLLNDYIIPGDFPGLFKMLLVMGPFVRLRCVVPDSPFYNAVSAGAPALPPSRLERDCSLPANFWRYSLGVQCLISRKVFVK